MSVEDAGVCDGAIVAGRLSRDDIAFILGQLTPGTSICVEHSGNGMYQSDRWIFERFGEGGASRVSAMATERES